METPAYTDIQLANFTSVRDRIPFSTMKMADDNAVYAPIPVSSRPPAATDIPTAHTISPAVYAPTPISSQPPAEADIKAEQEHTMSPAVYSPTPIASQPPVAIENIEIIPPPVFIPRSARRPRSRQITLQGIREAVKEEEEEEARNPTPQPLPKKSNKKAKHKNGGAPPKKGKGKDPQRSEVMEEDECFSDMPDISSDVSLPCHDQDCSSPSSGAPHDPSLTSPATDLFEHKLMSATPAASDKTPPYDTTPEIREGWETEKYNIKAYRGKPRRHKRNSKHRRPMEETGEEDSTVKRQKLEAYSGAVTGLGFECNGFSTSTPLPPSSPIRVLKVKIKCLKKNLISEEVEEKNALQVKITENDASAVVTEEVQSRNLSSIEPEAKVRVLFDLNEPPPSADD